MNNKIKTYILLAAVLGIWVTIGYKIVSGFDSDEPKVTSQEFNHKFTPKIIDEVAHFSIKNVERDPFLGTIASVKKKKLLKKGVLKQQFIKKMPSITYGGTVKKQDTKNQIFVININNHQHLLKVGQVADSVKLIRGNSKEIVVRYNRKSQTIKRQ